MEGSTKQQVRGDQGMIGIPALIDCPMSLCMWTDSRESTKIHLQHTTKLQAHAVTKEEGNATRTRTSYTDHWQ